ncbi:helix-turn-helix transcriptional regulator [Vibrio sp. Isolate24]|uniref:helix-turn-helix domain-containing protein n=1 Tax=Vibrio sp. Isolate24 TaxID=2908534 RepID=UPI001EFD566E|nr:helix-turn-helix transcriptional regulator [Vibrio sp. Isolate24]MCG9677001.1 helix-turn-helix domain-containing protein [Vibrio sp. Isolate24]
MKVDGNKLKEIREKRLLTQESLAMMSGLSIRTIQRVEKTGIASKETIQSLQATLDINTLTLLPKSKNNIETHRALKIVTILFFTLALDCDSYNLYPKIIYTKNQFLDNYGNHIMSGGVELSFKNSELSTISSDSIVVHNDYMVTGKNTELEFKSSIFQSDESIINFKFSESRFYSDLLAHPLPTKNEIEE